MENPSLTYAHVQLGLNECTLHRRTGERQEDIRVKKHAEAQLRDTEPGEGD